MKRLKHFAGINKPFLFVLPDKHGSYKIEKQKLILLKSIGVSNVLLEGYIKDGFLRSGEFMLTSDLLRSGFGVHQIEDVKLFDKVAFMFDIFYLVCFKFSNLFIDFEKFSPDFLNNFKFLSPHESIDSTVYYLKKEYDLDFDFKNLNYENCLELVAEMQSILDFYVLNKRNQVFTDAIDNYFASSFSNSGALVVGRKHLSGLYNILKGKYNLVEV